MQQRESFAKTDHKLLWNTKLALVHLAPPDLIISGNYLENKTKLRCLFPSIVNNIDFSILKLHFNIQCKGTKKV